MNNSKKHNSNNERIKHKYYRFLKEAKRLSEASIDGVAMSISRFEHYGNHKDFKAFHFEQAVAFKKNLECQTSKQTGKPLSKATINSSLRYLKSFFQWLSQESGYKSRLNYTDMEYFNLSEKDTRIATAKRERRVPTVEQVLHVIGSMGSDTPIERRNRALIAFTLLSGARDSAIASMKLKHVDTVQDRVIQDAREVNTKNSKTFISDFFPVDGLIREIVVDWISYLKTEHLFGNDDPLFPKTAMRQNDNKEFEAYGLLKECWSTANPIRTIFKSAFEDAGLEYFNPHSFRKTLVGLGQRICQNPEEFKAWSQNLGHENVLTTYLSYGEVQPQRQSEIFKRLKEPKQPMKTNYDVGELAIAIAKEMGKKS